MSRGVGALGGPVRGSAVNGPPRHPSRSPCGSGNAACARPAGKIARQAEIDSNGVENLIRPIALTRKNALFAGYDEGGRSWACIASLIATARINNVEPFAYLKGTLEAVAAGRPQEKIDDLLPWNFMPSR